MGPATERLLQAVLALPEEERLELVKALLDSTVLSDGLPFDPAWLDVARRRSDEVDAGVVHLDSWSIVRERVRGAQS